MNLLQIALHTVLLSSVVMADQPAGARSRPLPAPPPLAPHRPTVIRGDVSALAPTRLDQPDLRPHITDVWQNIQPDLDRSMLRLDDVQTYELNRLERARQAYRPEAAPRERFALFQFEQDRQELTQRVRDHDPEKRRDRTMRTREYELWLHAGLRTAIGMQADADRAALQDSRHRRDAAVATATRSRDEALHHAKDAADQSAAVQQFRTQSEAAERLYQSERSRILGVPAPESEGKSQNRTPKDQPH